MSDWTHHRYQRKIKELWRQCSISRGDLAYTRPIEQLSWQDNIYISTTYNGIIIMIIIMMASPSRQICLSSTHLIISWRLQHQWNKSIYFSGITLMRTSHLLSILSTAEGGEGVFHCFITSCIHHSRLNVYSISRFQGRVINGNTPHRIDPLHIIRYTGTAFCHRGVIRRMKCWPSSNGTWECRDYVWLLLIWHGDGQRAAFIGLSGLVTVDE